MDAVLTCMVSDSLGPGALTERLVAAVSEYLGLAGGIALRERGRALGIAIEELGLAAGDRIVLDPLVPHSYHETLIRLGITPVYVDVAPGSVVIDPVAVEREAPNASAVITAGHLGFVPEMERIAAAGLPVIEDISDAFGANTPTSRAGTSGRYTILAMEPDGIITAGGGTLLLTGGRRERASLRRLSELLPPDALLPDMNAALGTTQIREIERFVARRAEIAAVFAKALMRGRHRAVVQSGDSEPVAFTFPVLIEGSVGDVVAYARKKGVEAIGPFADSVLARYAARSAPDGQPDGQDGDAEAPERADPLDSHRLVEDDYPVARSMLLRCLRFPLYPSLTSKEVELIERTIVSLP